MNKSLFDKFYIQLVVLHFTSKVRAANLSGDCFFAKENFGRLRFGWSKHQQVSMCCCNDTVIMTMWCAINRIVLSTEQ